MKTKKTIIIILAVAAIAAIVYFVFFRQKTAKSIIEGLDTTDTNKERLLRKLTEVEGWDKSHIESQAKAQGRNFQQQLVAEAAYSLYATDNLLTWAEYNGIIIQL